MSTNSCDVLILGGGMVGLSIAHQLLERGITNSITILDKEPELGLHSSGRNSEFYMPACTTNPVHSKPESALKVRGDSAIGSKSVTYRLTRAGK